MNDLLNPANPISPLNPIHYYDSSTVSTGPMSTGGQIAISCFITLFGIPFFIAGIALFKAIFSELALNLPKGKKPTTEGLVIVSFLIATAIFMCSILPFGIFCFTQIK